MLLLEGFSEDVSTESLVAGLDDFLEAWFWCLLSLEGLAEEDEGAEEPFGWDEDEEEEEDGLDVELPLLVGDFFLDFFDFFLFDPFAELWFPFELLLESEITMLAPL